MWAPDNYLQAMIRHTTPKFRFGARSVEEWRAWRQELLPQFAADLGGFPVEPAPLAAREIEAVACDGYVRKRVVITTYPGLEMPVYVLEPERQPGENARRPAVVACHGHGYGSKEIVGLNKDGSVQTDPGYQHQFAVRLAKRGFVVIVPELLGFGDRRLQEAQRKDTYSSCHEISAHLLQFGQTMAGHRVYETIRAIDYASSREDVDALRIGAMGISGGGLVVTFAAALDERVRAAVVSGYINTFASSILAMHHCIDNYVPGLQRHAELPDIACLIAPRPLLVEAGTEDPIFPIDATLAALDQLASAYALLGAEEKLERDVFAGDHRISGAVAYDFLARELQLT
ncbi:dienelactone hydrolase family protein [Paenibacillus cymbidii]|uniref:dienelactone hydrolase family protein n=1 Tax=Paenibacillus cymbidii TaxID=1639034 RepID=UPI00108091A3|nr:alpha/beta hydrolase family protein [Paenibacillus cymbidii]